MSELYYDLLFYVRAAALAPDADLPGDAARRQMLRYLQSALEHQENKPGIAKRRRTEINRTRQAISLLLKRRES